MKIKQLLLLSAASVLMGGGVAVTGKALANQSFLVAQSSPTSGPRAGWGGPRHEKFAEQLGLTATQQTQLKQIHEATRQQMDTIPTAAQKAQMEAIRADTKTKMDAVLTEQQRQQLQQTPAASSGQPKGPGFARLSGLTDGQKAQLKQIHEATHQQIEAIFSSEQKSRMAAIRQDAKSRMDAVLTDQQRQQLQQLRQQKQDRRQQS